VKKACEYCVANNVKTVTVLGGEPTLHPEIIDVCMILKRYGLNVVMTTNYSKPEIIRLLDTWELVDSFNISHYNQTELPNANDFKADLTLSKLLFKGEIDSKEKLDMFINKYQDQFDDIKFSTLTDINDFTHENKDLPFLDNLWIETKVTIMGEIQGHYYRGYLIKRFDIKATEQAYCKRSMKAHPNGELKRTW
jgi:organic radical activating enzyme